MWMPLRIREAVEIGRHRRMISEIDRACDVELAGTKSDDRAKVEDRRRWETSLYVDQI